MTEPVRMFSARLPESLIRRFRAYAAMQGRSVQDIVRELIEAAVKDVPNATKRRSRVKKD